MAEVDAHFDTLRVCEFDDVTNRPGLAIVSKSRVFWSDTALWGHRGGFDESEARTARKDSSNYEVHTQISEMSAVRAAYYHAR